MRLYISIVIPHFTETYQRYRLRGSWVNVKRAKFKKGIFLAWINWKEPLGISINPQGPEHPEDFWKVIEEPNKYEFRCSV